MAGFHGRWASIVAVLGFTAFAALLFSPSRIHPVARDPGVPMAMVGPLAPNDALRDTMPLVRVPIAGPEDIAIDDLGRIYTGTADGRIVRIAGENIDEFAATGGRPLGLAFDPHGNLVVADASRGLLSIAPDGTIVVLVTEVGGIPLKMTDGVDVASDGRIYFSDASTYGEGEYLLDLLEGRPHGRLLRHDPSTGETEVLLDDLYFANGVALSPAEDFVLVVESYAHRITRYWLRGERADTQDTFVADLPGYPDGVSSNGRGTYWVALFTVRNAAADWLAPRPWAKRVLAKSPRFLWPRPAPHGFVIALDENGNVLQSLQDPGGERVPQVTSAREHQGMLYLGSVDGESIGRYPL